MSKDYVIALKESLDKKLKTLEEIRRMSQEQSDILSRDSIDYEAFDALVDDKDICIERIEKLDEGFETVYERVKEELQNNKDQYKELISQIQELIAKITDQSTAIQALETRNKNTLTTVFNKERKQLSEGKRSVNVAMNYYKNMNGLNAASAQFLDKKK